MKFLNVNSNICCNDVIQCVYNLNNLDIIVYKKLKQNRELRADELAKLVNKDRSTIYRSLQKLTYCGICRKKINYIEKGGLYYTYAYIGSKKTKKKLEKCIENWYRMMKDTLKDLDNEL